MLFPKAAPTATQLEVALLGAVVTFAFAAGAVVFTTGAAAVLSAAGVDADQPASAKTATAPNAVSFTVFPFDGDDRNLDLSRVVRSRFARSSRNQPVDRGAAFVLVDGGVDLGRAQGL